MALQRFIDENSASLEQLSKLNFVGDYEVTQKSLKDVFLVIKELRTYFLKNIAQPEFNGLENEEINKRVKEAYGCYDEVIKSWKAQDEEKAFYHGYHAAQNLTCARNIGYQPRGNDFFIVIVSVLIAFKLGLFRTAGGLLLDLMKVAEYTNLLKKFENMLLFCTSKFKYYKSELTTESADSKRVELWLGNMISYWSFVTLEHGRLDDEKELSDLKILYLKILETTHPQKENLRKSTLSRIVRFEFVCLVHFFAALCTKNTQKQTIVRVQDEKKTHEVKDKLTKLIEDLEKHNAIEENASSYTYLILLLSSISYHLLKDYHAAVHCFERTKSAFEKLGDHPFKLKHNVHPFKLMFEMIKFEKFESSCKEKSFRIQSDPKDTIPLTPSERLNLEEELSRKHNPTVNERLKNEEDDIEAPIIGEEHEDVTVESGFEEKYAVNDDDEMHDEIESPIVREEHEDEEVVVEQGFEEKQEAHHNVDKVFHDWVYEGDFAYDLMNDYSFASVKRSLDNEDGYEEEEEGTLIRYRNLSVAKKERHALKVIEKSCPGGSQFIMRAMSPINKQTVRKGCENISVYDFVVERGIPFACWLEDRKKAFEKDHQRKEEWWEFIKKDVKRLFRGVVRGLLVLSSLDLPFLGFHNGAGIFICDMYGISCAKIKPCVEDDEYKLPGEVTNQVRDIRGLRRILSWVIMCPFQSTGFEFKEEIVKEYSLDLEMKLCLQALDDKFLSNALTPLKYDHLIDAPLFWTKEERIGFLFKWTELAQRLIIPPQIDSYVDFKSYGSWHAIIDGLKKGFGEESLEKMEDHVLHAIYSKEDNSYNDSKDVVRFGVHTIKHYNSSNYCSIRPEILTDIQIEAILRARIPDLYFALVQAISTCFCENNLQWDHRDVCLKELLSRRFPKGECDEGCSPYVVCDHLLE